MPTVDLNMIRLAPKNELRGADLAAMDTWAKMDTYLQDSVFGSSIHGQNVFVTSVHGPIVFSPRVNVVQML